MSQHFIRLDCTKIGGTALLQLGWDKPLGEFYLVVFADDATHCEDEEGLVYSNLSDSASAGQDLEYFKSIAALIGCQVPDALWRAAYQDSEFNVVNKTVYYSPAGEVVDPY